MKNIFKGFYFKPEMHFLGGQPIFFLKCFFSFSDSALKTIDAQLIFGQYFWKPPKKIS